MLELQGNISSDGKLTVYNQQALTDWRLANSGKEIMLALKIKRKNRSSKQNAYYWGVVVDMIRDAMNKLGNDFDVDETHEFLKARFNAKEVEVTDGHYVDIPQSTSRLDTKEFMDYVEKIQQFGAQMLGIYIPSPNEQVQIDFYLNQH